MRSLEFAAELCVWLLRFIWLTLQMIIVVAVSIIVGVLGSVAVIIGAIASLLTAVIGPTLFAMLTPNKMSPEDAQEQMSEIGDPAMVRFTNMPTAPERPRPRLVE